MTGWRWQQRRKRTTTERRKEGRKGAGKALVGRRRRHHEVRRIGSLAKFGLRTMCMANGDGDPLLVGTTDEVEREREFLHAGHVMVAPAMGPPSPRLQQQRLASWTGLDCAFRCSARRLSPSSLQRSGDFSLVKRKPCSHCPSSFSAVATAVLSNGSPVHTARPFDHGLWGGA